MSERDDGRLRKLLHPCFTWTSHQGERFDVDSYMKCRANGTRGLDDLSRGDADALWVLEQRGPAVLYRLDGVERVLPARGGAGLGRRAGPDQLARRAGR